MFFSGIPYNDQVAQGGGSASVRVSPGSGPPRKLGSPPPASIGGGARPLMWGEDRLRNIHRRAVGFLVGAISGAATGGASVVIFRPRGRIASRAPQVARAAFRGAGLFSGGRAAIRNRIQQSQFGAAMFADMTGQVVGESFLFGGVGEFILGAFGLPVLPSELPDIANQLK